MIPTTNKHITIQFHLNSRNYLESIPVTHKKQQDGNFALEAFARKNAYDYSLFPLKNEIHIRVPETYLLQNIIQTKTAQWQAPSSNKVPKSESGTLSLVNFMGDVIFSFERDNPKPNTNSPATAAFLRGFIKTNQERRIFHYSKEEISRQAYDTINANCNKYNYKHLANQCIGIVHVCEQSNISVHSGNASSEDFDFSSEVQCIKQIAPDVRIVRYSGISILSALKTALTDNVNQPGAILIQYGTPIFEYSSTELKELKYYFQKAQENGINIIVPWISAEKDSNKLLFQENVLKHIENSIKAVVDFSNEKPTKKFFGIVHNNSYYKIAANEFNPVMWAIHSLHINALLNRIELNQNQEQQSNYEDFKRRVLKHFAQSKKAYLPIEQSIQAFGSNLENQLNYFLQNKGGKYE